MTRMSLRRIDLASLGKMGCLLGTVAAFLPSLLCGLLAMGIAVALYRWLQGWQQASVGLDLPLIGEQSLTFDLVELLRLNGVLSFLEGVAAASAVSLILVVLLLALGAGLILAVTVTLVGIAYNFVASVTGGLVVEIKPLGVQEAAHAVGPPELPSSG